MIKINDTIIQADTEDMLKTLKAELYTKGINRFAYFRRNGDNIQCPCPFHKNGQERKASFGVNGNLNKCHCFTCGWSGGIEDMISELFGFVDSKYGKRWLIKRFNTVEIETRPNIMEGFNGRKINLPSGLYKSIETASKGKSREMGKAGQGNEYEKNRDLEEGDKTVITEEELDKYRYIHPYMYERGLTDEIIERFDIGYDRERKEITFPVRDIEGRCVFVAGRSVERKFFRLPKGMDKPVYCSHLFRYGTYKTAFITESFLNCLTCWKYDKPAMAMIGTGNSRQYEILNKLPVREYILAFDPDEAGRKATQRFKQNVKGKIIKEIIYEEDGKDINDLQERFLELKTTFL